jgi:murein L,D-transpeptidase YcbB/YkuD
LGVNWRRVPAGTFPYQVQQQPGRDNALGRIKLELPNRFDVYLHDTPARKLFARPGRALSHGCVRVEQILPLATYALADPRAADRIGKALAMPETSHLPLQHRLPVYFLYWTALPDAHGAVQVVPDIYGRDARLVAAMKAPAMQIASLSAACQRG